MLSEWPSAGDAADGIPLASFGPSYSTSPCTASTRRALAQAGSAARSAADHIYAIPATWRGRYGAQLGGVELALRFHGADHGPTVLALGGVSADRRVAGADGWWRDVAKAGGGLDLDRVQLIGADYVAAETPVDLCPEDYAALIADALRDAGVDRLDAVIGASFGGMAALAFARRFPKRVKRLCVISAAHRPDPAATALRHIQRRILALGETAGAPAEGVAIARALAMTTYRTPEEFRDRFDGGLGAEGRRSVGAYLDARGRAYAENVNAARYQTLCAAIDRHAEDPAAVRTPTLAIGVPTDRLQPLGDIAAMADALAGPAVFRTLSSPYGHDAFLKEPAALGAVLAAFLNGEIV